MSKQNSVKKVRLSRSDRNLEIVLVIMMIFLIVIEGYPLIYIVSSSFSDSTAVMSGKVWFFPVGFSLEGYKAVFRTNSVLIGYRNSLLYMVLGTVINDVMTCLAAYALSRKDMPGHGFITMIFMFTMIFSGGMIPSYLLMRDLKLLNTIWVMVIPGAIGIHNMIITRTYFVNSIPHEMLEAAQIDGCSDWQYFLRMVLPLSGSVIAVITLYYAVGHWNAYFNAILYLSNSDLYPLQIFLRDILIASKVTADMLVQDDMSDVPEGLEYLLKYSLIIVATLPVMLIYPFVQKHFVKGVMIGAVKG